VTEFADTSKTDAEMIVDEGIRVAICHDLIQDVTHSWRVTSHSLNAKPAQQTTNGAESPTQTAAVKDEDELLEASADQKFEDNAAQVESLVIEITVKDMVVGSGDCENPNVKVIREIASQKLLIESPSVQKEG